MRGWSDEQAVRWGKIESNPARGVRKLASAPRERRLSTAEIARLGTAMRTLAAAGEHPTGLAAIRLLLLTGFRRMECLALQRAWVDAEQRAIRLPETKTGPQMRVVGQAAIDLILAQPVTDGSPYVFPADWGDGPRNAQLIVESHSEHFLNRLQRRIAEGIVTHDQVAIYFARRAGASTELEPLRLNEYGDIENWPENFFGDEMADLTARTVAAGRRRQQENSK